MHDVERIRQKIINLQARRAQESDQDLIEALDQMIGQHQHQLSLLAQQAAAVVEPPAPAAAQGQVYGSSVMTNLGHVWINQVFNAPLSTGERTDQLILHYLAHVQGNADRLVLGTDVQDSDQERMSLQRVFTMLQADFYGPIAGDALLQSLLLGSPQPRPQLQDSILKALNQIQHQRSVILGVPGGGKTTVVSYLASAQAAALLDPSKAEFLHSQGWMHTKLVPVRVRLKHVQPPADPEQQTADAFWEVVTELQLAGRFGQRAINSDVGFQRIEVERQQRLQDAIEELLINGNGLLLLDGLDEVQPEHLAAVKRCIEHAQRMFHKSRIIVTCRVFDYEHPLPPPFPSRQLYDWPTIQLMPFDLTAQHVYITNYYSELGRLHASHADIVSIRKKHAKLHAELMKSGMLHELTRTPLLLALTVHVNMVHTDLPESEGKLLHICIDELLKRRAPEAIAVSLEDLYDLVALLGYYAHSQEEIQGKALLSLQQINMVVQRYYSDRYPHPNQIHMLAQAVGNATLRLINSNGLLQEASNNQQDNPHYDFAHRLFQQFLAGMYLLNQERHDECIERAGSEHWRVCLHYMANFAPYIQKQSFIFGVIQDLLGGMPDEQVQGSHLLLAIGKAKVASAGRRNLWQQAVNHLKNIGGLSGSSRGVRRWAPPRIAFPTRLRAALVLGAIGDTRFIGEDGALIALTERVVCIHAGSVELEDPHARPQTYHVERFWMSRYLLTNFEYSQFIAARGYLDDQWWQNDDARHWRRGDPSWLHGLPPWAVPRRLPDLWHNERFNHPTQPIVGVNWYEANAFCAWLTMQLRPQLDALGPNLVVRLPSEAEWQLAASQHSEREYPWGDEWRNDHANTSESELEQPTPVGMFPYGTWSDGPMDLAGNVCEWTNSINRDPELDPQTTRNRRLQHRDLMVAVRGGSWFHNRYFARCRSRLQHRPFSHGPNIGVRLIIGQAE